MEMALLFPTLKLHIYYTPVHIFQSNYTNSTYIYTDGSKDAMRVGCAMVSDNYSENMRILDGSSIFTAEAKAIDLALDFTAVCEISNNFLIFSDSLSVLKSLDHTS